MILAWAAAAWAGDDIAGWTRLQDGLLLESADGDLAGAIEVWRDMVRNLADDDPIRADALIELGQALYAQGDTEGAETALREADRMPGPAGARALEIISQIEIDRASVTTVPVKWTFDEPLQVVRPFGVHAQGSMNIANLDGDAALEWVTRVDIHSDDELVVGFRSPSPAPKGIRMRARSLAFETKLRLSLYDDAGHEWTANVTVPMGDWGEVDVKLKDALPVDRTQGRLDPGELDRLVIRDRSAFYGHSGQNTIDVDDLEIY